jgi:hypothetical protein
VTEIASVHGMSEAADAPTPVTGALEGNFVRDVLIHGARLGFIGSGDSHDGHPGLAQIASGQGGLAGLFSEDLDRASLLAALKSRRTFATNGIRAWLEVSIDGVGMGGVLEPGEGEHDLRIRFEATAPVERIDLVRTGHVASIAPPTQTSLSLDLERRIPRLAPASTTTSASSRPMAASPGRARSSSNRAPRRAVRERSKPRSRKNRPKPKGSPSDRGK